MSQSTLDDDELFGEAASEVRADVEEHLDAAREALPDADDIWEMDAENTLGALNGFRSALDVGDAADHIRDARKWYTMGERAGAFEDTDDLEAELDDLTELVADIGEARELVGDLTALVPALRSALDAADEAAEAEEEEEEEEEADEEDDE